MEEAMKESGLDVAYRKPLSIEGVIEHSKPDMIITMGCGDQCPLIPGVVYEDWDLDDPAGRPIEFMRTIRDEIEQRVKKLIETL
jgi:protein-tyrosine-phosphatase